MVGVVMFDTREFVVLVFVTFVCFILGLFIGLSSDYEMGSTDFSVPGEAELYLEGPVWVEVNGEQVPIGLMVWPGHRGEE